MGRARVNPASVFQTITNMRNLQATRLNREYAPTARRLNELYQEKLKVIQDALAKETLRKIAGVIIQEFADISQMVQLEAPALQTSGVKAGYDLALPILNKGGVEVRATTAQLNTLLITIDYVSTQAFQNAVGGYGAYHAEVVGQLITAGQANGLNSQAVAAQIWQYFAGTPQKPLRDIENLTRTLMNYSARRATSEVYKANGVRFWIWVANLGNPRTCLSCVMQHGTLHDIDKEPFLADHHRGRCAQAPLTPTWQQMGIVGGRDLSYPTGQEYFDNLSDTQKRLLLGADLFEAYRLGQAIITPDTVTGSYTNPIFGEMKRRNTNAEILRLSQP